MGNIPQHTNYIAYARVPPDRLLSGLLTVNVRNAYDNTDGKDDTTAAYNDHWGSLSNGQKQSYPYGNEQPITDDTSGSKAVRDPGRTDQAQSFGDYDCFLFWVAGGMTQHSTLTYTGEVLNPAGYASSGTWYSAIQDLRCNSYVRSHLIARANNAHGHNNDGTTYYYKGEGIKTEKALANDAVATSAATGTHGADGIHTEYIYNNTTYSASHAAHDNKFTLQSVGNNTFYTPVRDVIIHGSHRLVLNTNTKGGSPDLYSLNVHDSTFWSLKVEVLLWGYQNDNSTGTDDAGATGTADKIRTDYNINVFYQPFGETPSLDFSTTAFTS